ncbi:MAG: hypothetical protein LBG11_07365 [Bifidobacteriaceae bacterium]|jgi:hypothetical protein|nr:hypothetical protein [Bifidobacteriaceae bacterium]
MTLPYQFTRAATQLSGADGGVTSLATSGNSGAAASWIHLVLAASFVGLASP